MAVTALSRAGLAKNAGADDRLEFLQIFGGEVLAFFKQVNPLMGLVRTKRPLRGAKSALFPTVWKSSTNYHTPGDWRLQDGSYLNAIDSTQKEIFLDNKLTSDTFVADIDEIMEYWEARQQYVAALGQAHADQVELDQHAVLIAAALSTETFTTLGGSSAGAAGSIDITGTGGYDATEIAGANVTAFTDELFTAAAVLDRRNIPKTERYCALRPETYRDIVRYASDYLDRDYNPDNGSKSSGEIRRIAGFQLVVTNAMPDTQAEAANTNVKNDPWAAAAGLGVDYTTDEWDRHIATCFHPTAMGTVIGQDVRIQTEWRPDFDGWPIYSDLMVGHNVLRPESAIVIRTTLPDPP